MTYTASVTCSLQIRSASGQYAQLIQILVLHRASVQYGSKTLTKIKEFKRYSLRLMAQCEPDNVARFISRYSLRSVRLVKCAEIRLDSDY
jgi:hypothetical protein